MTAGNELWVLLGRARPGAGGRRTCTAGSTNLTPRVIHFRQRPELLSAALTCLGGATQHAPGVEIRLHSRTANERPK